MKKFISLLLAVVAIAVCSSVISPIASSSQEVSAATPEKSNGVYEARFLNMLNHNFVYNADFDNLDDLINNSALALLNLRDAENEDYIAEGYVKDFVKDMYGIEIADMSALNCEFPQLDGYLFIIPRGYTTYKHSIVSVDKNEDGSYTVVSNVTATGHDTAAKTQKAVSLFVENENSAFGYNMIYCNILSDSSDI